MTAPLLTLDQVAEQLAVSVPTVRRLVRRGDLAVIRVGGQNRVRPADLDAYIAAARVESAHERRRATIHALPPAPPPRRSLPPGYWRR